MPRRRAAYVSAEVVAAIVCPAERTPPPAKEWTRRPRQRTDEDKEREILVGDNARRACGQAPGEQVSVAPPSGRQPCTIIHAAGTDVSSAACDHVAIRPRTIIPAGENRQPTQGRTGNLQDRTGSGGGRTGLKGGHDRNRPRWIRRPDPTDFPPPLTPAANLPQSVRRSPIEFTRAAGGSSGRNKAEVSRSAPFRRPSPASPSSA